MKNANSFLSLADYPFAKLASDESFDDALKQKLGQQNWLLVFDDNTNSGETLDNLKNLAKESGFYGRIDVFPCRASTNIENYKKSLTDEERLDMVINSAIPSRKAKVNPE